MGGEVDAIVEDDRQHPTCLTDKMSTCGIKKTSTKNESPIYCRMVKATDQEECIVAPVQELNAFASGEKSLPEIEYIIKEESCTTDESHTCNHDIEDESSPMKSCRNAVTGDKHKCRNVSTQEFDALLLKQKKIKDVCRKKTVRNRFVKSMDGVI